MQHLYKLNEAQCIAALSSSILKHYHIRPVNPGYPPVDQLLVSAPRNIVLLLLDGLGQNILEQHLPEDSFLRRHQTDILFSVFPPTTAAAATALETGLFPSQSGWLGWTVFWPPLGKNIALYPNTTEDGAQASEEHIGNTYLAVDQLTQVIRKQVGIPAVSIYEQGDIHAKTLDQVLTEVARVCQEPGEHFIYGYVNEPDHLLHRHGCCAAEIGQWLLQADKQLGRLRTECPDSLFLLTADHGFIDVEPLCLEDYPELENTLLRKPSIEPRSLNIFLKSGQEQDFLTLWKQIMGDNYTLYTREQVLQQHLFGPDPNHPMLEEMLGDYLAVANSPVTLFPNSAYMKTMKATHGGMMQEERMVPLIVWETEKNPNDRKLHIETL